MEVAPDYIIIYGNSRLNVMFDTVSRSADSRCNGMYSVVQIR